MIYQINLSKGQVIKIDEEDLSVLKENITAKLIRLKQAIVNPAFIVSITPTEEDEFIAKPKVVIEGDIAKIVGEEKIRTLADKMNINKLLT